MQKPFPSCCCHYELASKRKNGRLAKTKKPCGKRASVAIGCFGSADAWLERRVGLLNKMLSWPPVTALKQRSSMCALVKTVQGSALRQCVLGCVVKQT